METKKIVQLFWSLLVLELCSGQNDVTDSSTTATKTSSSESNENYTLSSSSSEERDGVQPRIIGGRPTRTGEFPYQIQLIFKGHHGACGGALVISPSSGKQIGVTAAHCVYGRTADQFEIFAGSNVIDDKYAQRLKVKKIVPHEKFLENPYSYDIAVIIFDGQFHIEAGVKPLSLPTKKQRVKGNITVTGWGRLLGLPDPQYFPKVLQALVIPVIPLKQCQAIFRKLTDGSEVISENNLCAGNMKGEQGTCNGDSGGPAMGQDTNGNRFLAGVVSFGVIGCDSKHTPGVYARVSKFIDWIDTASSHTNMEDDGDGSGMKGRTVQKEDYLEDYSMYF